MTKKTMKVAVINRSFWPVYPVIGEALLRFAEGASRHGHSLSVIMQGDSDLKDKLFEADRGKGVNFYPAKALTTSSSGVLFRACDALFFTCWVIAVLVWVRPCRVYVSTDPPVVVPFIVMLYSLLFRAEYIYHLQDIHPEAANVVIPVNKWIFKLLLKMDVLSMQNAKCLITITDLMVEEIRSRSRTSVPIHVLDNPAVSFDGIDSSKAKVPGFSFCGNAGRLQRIPLMLEAIETYLQLGGHMEFIFAGGGIYAERLKSISEKYSRFNYLGLVCPTEAAQINADYTWALLPIEDEVTRFAFPSKSSSYVFSGAKILAICGKHTSVANWVLQNQVGLVVTPEVEAVVNVFFDIEMGLYQESTNEISREALKTKLRFEVFIEALNTYILE